MALGDSFASFGRTLSGLNTWLCEGADNSSDASGYRTHITVRYYERVHRAFTNLAERKVNALNYVTERVIADGLPMRMQNAYIEVFLAIDPQKALPETLDSVDQILASAIGRSSLAPRLRDFRRRFPKKGFLESLFG